MNVADFDFHLPPALIAQEPPAERGRSRLLVLDRTSGAVHHASMSDLPAVLEPSDLLVVNDTRVFPARLLGHRVPSGGAVECLLIGRLAVRGETPASTETGDAPGSQGATSEHIGPYVSEEQRSEAAGSPTRVSQRVGVQEGCSAGRMPAEFHHGLLKAAEPAQWQALMHPGHKLRVGERVVFERDDIRVRIHGEILARHFFGRRTVRLWTDDNRPVDAAIEDVGHMPLPPYIKRPDGPDDRARYQTVYAQRRGSIAAPTAGLHFTGPLLDALAARGIERAAITLHVGYGTFKPVRTDRVEDHVVDPEAYEIGEAAAHQINDAHAGGRRIVAVGTTTVRTLESAARTEGGARVAPGPGEADLFVYPGHRFALVGGLLTNFHLPRSSLLMLVCAFAGRDRVLAAYREAIDRGYRFYSYGDAMLIR